MEVYVNIRGAMEYGLDEVEEVIGEALAELGEVTGSGTGNKGSNFDIEITDDSSDVLAIVRVVQKALASFNFPVSSVIIVQGKEYPLKS